ncbi:MAG TPA: PAS domain S-box protein, partial [Candidatus Angelobacter sp.]|nr:PAS domain S-box protein [Candidatus Angelobacter sp.]
RRRALAIGRLFVYRQLVLTLVLVALFWFLYARLHRQEFLRWWGLAWTSFAAYLGITALIFHLAPEWTLLKSSLIFFSILARFLQIPLLVFAAWSMRSQEVRLRRWLKPGLGLALIGGALTFAVSFIYRDQAVISVAVRSAPHSVGLTMASFFYAFSFFERWQRNRSSSATVLAGMSCVLYGLDQVLYSVTYIRSLILGANAVRLPLLPFLVRQGIVLRQPFDFPLLVHPAVLFLEGLSSCGIAVGMVLLVMESRQKTQPMEHAVREHKDPYSDLGQHSKDLLCTHDLQGRLLSVNPAPARVLGYEVDELLRIPMRQLLAPDFRDRFDTYLARIQKKGEASGLMKVLTRTGEERVWEYHNWLHTEGVPSPIVRGIAHDVTERIRAEQHYILERRHAEERLRQLSSHLVQAQDDERARIARELHDDVNQRLAVLAFHLQELKRLSMTSESHIQKIDTLSNLISDIATDIRKVSHRLHPAVLDFVGLEAGLAEFCDEFAKVNGMNIEFVQHEVPRKLPKQMTLCLYRVAQEAVRNAQKHSGCRQVRVELIGGRNGIRLRVSDSGAGFDAASVRGDTLGLVSMTERVRSLGGEFLVESRPGGGTTVEARVPFREEWKLGRTMPWEEVS